MSTPYNPLSVMMGQPGKTGVPYIGGRPPGSGSVGPVSAGQFTSGSPPINKIETPVTSKGSVSPVSAGQFTSQGGPSVPFTPSPAGNVMGPESVRATGTGPFDNAYRQDLATYAGGLFNRPGGNLSFNPTSPGSFGQPTGAGNASLPGMPNTLLQNALGGNPFSYTPPQPQSVVDPIQAWLDQFMNQGGGTRTQALE